MNESQQERRSEERRSEQQVVVQGTGGGGGANDADLFDYPKLRDYLGYVLGSVRRHKVRVCCIVVAVVGTTAGILAVLPRTYHCESKLLASRNQIISALGNPGRNTLDSIDVPLRTASATVMRHDNLVSIVKQTDLVDSWMQHRNPLARLKERLRGMVRPPFTKTQLLGQLTGLLTTRIEVIIGDGTVTLGVDWQDDAAMSCRLVDAAQQNFLEARHAAEISTITEAISILENHAIGVRKDIDGWVAQMEAARTRVEQRQSKGRATNRPAPQRLPTRGSAQKSPAVVQLEASLEAKRRAIRELEETQRNRMQELQRALATQKATYSDTHPAVIEVQQRIDELQKSDREQLDTQHEEQAELVERLLAAGGNDPEAASQAEERLGPLPAHIVRMEAETRESDDPVIEHARGEVSFAMTKYATLLDRIDSARMELDTSRAAFKYRYTIVAPSEIPRNPIAPNAGKVMMGGIIAALVLAVLTAAAIDIRSGRILERWQVKRQLDLDVIAELISP